MISSTRWRCAISSLSAGPIAQQLPEEAALHLQGAAGHDVVERAHALEQRDVLEGARDAATRRIVRLHLGPRLALEGDAAMLRLVEAVDDVEHGGLAGAIRADDGAHLALLDIERHVADRAHAAERQRNVFDREDDLAGGNVAGGRRSHGATQRAPTLPWRGRVAERSEAGRGALTKDESPPPGRLRRPTSPLREVKRVRGTLMPLSPARAARPERSPRPGPSRVQTARPCGRPRR